MIERHWNADLIAQAIGSVFVISGVLAWSPNPLVSSQGFFVANAPHTLIHLTTGVLLVAAPSYKFSVRAIRIVAFVYAALAGAGLLLPWPIFGVIELNGADQWLHMALAMLLFAIGYGLLQADVEASAH